MCRCPGRPDRPAARLGTFSNRSCSSFLTFPGSLQRAPVSEPAGYETLFHFHPPTAASKFTQTGGWGGRAEREEGLFFFFFLSVPLKNGKQNAPSLPKVVPYYTLMYAHKRPHIHTHTHSDSHMIPEQNRMFSTPAPLRMSFILFSRRTAPFKKKKKTKKK